MRTICKSILKISCLGLLAATALNSQARDQYRVEFSADLKNVNVTACFDGQAPDRLYREKAAAQHGSEIQHKGKSLTTRGTGTLRLPSLPRDACLDWSVDLAAVAATQNYRDAFSVGESVLADTGLWFWRGGRDRLMEIDVQLPPGMSLSTPWTPVEGHKHRYHPTPTPANWTTRSAIGRFDIETLNVPGGVIKLALLGDMSRQQKTQMVEWIRATAAAVTPVFGEFPRRHTQVVVVPIGPRNEAVPWAHVVRGGGPSIQFYVDETRPLKEFQDDWTATHEFSHLLLPYVSRSDRWLSEGMASYYQNVLRARDGRLSEKLAWQKLNDGFKRGEKATKGDTLAEATNGGWGSTMRVYWSGAAMMLAADTQLRKETGGEQSLDTALKAFHDCCPEPGKRWSAREVFEHLDRLTGTDVFSTIYARESRATDFPDFAETYTDLGLSNRFGRIRLSDDAPLADVRRAIMRGDANDTRQGSLRDSAP